MSISGDETVYRAGTEAVLSSHPEIDDVAVYGRTHDKQGEVPIAAVVLAEGSSLTTADLGSRIDERLARFKHPTDLVVLEELPRNANGKVTTYALRENDPA